MYHEPFRTGKKHHLWHPAKSYQTELERRFRGLPCCVVPLSPQIHSLLHACCDGAAPQKPSVEYMAFAIERYEQGACGCSHHLSPKVINLNQYRERSKDARSHS